MSQQVSGKARGLNLSFFGAVGVISEVSLLSSHLANPREGHLANPREGHLEAVYNIFAYIVKLYQRSRTTKHTTHNAHNTQRSSECGTV